MEATITVRGQNTYDYGALVKLLIQKGIITEKELDFVMLEAYNKFSPAQWARRCIDDEENEVFDAFFE